VPTPPTPLRLFVALYPPEESRREFLRLVRKLDPPPDARSRVSPMEQVHMTLQFIGDRDERELDEVVESVRRSAAGVEPFRLTPLRLVTFPERGRPRLIALETDSPPGLLEIHRRLVQRLAKPTRSGRGRDDRFRPHLTLLRFTGSASPRDVDEPVRSDGAFLVSEIVLMRSVLKSGGAEHTVVEGVRLG
jgi:2'-5' RNA ligase